MHIKKSILGLVLAAASLAMVTATPASALEKVRFAYLKTQALAAFFYAQQAGYFADVGLNVEFVAVPGGPEVVAALASGEADFGYAAATPIAIARQAGQDLKFFIGLTEEKQPDQVYGFILASKASGIKTVADLKGRKVIIAQAGGLCEVMVRSWLATEGLKLTDVNALYTPFPQQAAALQTGAADATCTVDPFFTAMKNSRVNPVVVASGFVANATSGYDNDGVFASGDWVKAHPQQIKALKTALHRAKEDMIKNPDIAKKVLLKDYGMPEGLVNQLPNLLPAIDVSPADYAPIVEEMKKVGMLKQDFDVNAMVYSGK